MIKTKDERLKGTCLEELPVLFSNSTENDIAARDLLISAKLPYTTQYAVCDLVTPVLRYGLWQYDGIREIKQFIEGFKKGIVPDLSYGRKA